MMPCLISLEGPAAAMVRDLPKTNTQPRSSPEPGNPPVKENSLSERISLYPYPLSCLQTPHIKRMLGVSRWWNPGLRKSQHPGSCPRPWRNTSRTAAQASAWSGHSWGWVVGISQPFHSCSSSLTTKDPLGSRPQGNRAQPEPTVP